MSKQESIGMLSTLYLDKGDGKLEEFYAKREQEIAMNTTEVEGMVASACFLASSEDKNLIKSMFPSYNDRKIENLRERGVFNIDNALITSAYPLLGKNIPLEWAIGLSDIAKAVVSLIETKESYINERRLNAFISSEQYRNVFPSLEGEALSCLTGKIIESLFELEILKKQKRRIKLDRKKAFELISLDEVRLSSYLMFPKLDEWDRKKSFHFIHLIKKIKGAEREEIDVFILRAALISGFSYFKAEELFTFLLLMERDGLISSPIDEKTEGPVLISSDYSVSFLGSASPLIALIAEPVRIDRMKIYQISKESILNAFSLSYTDEEVIRILESVSDYKLSKMLSSRISIWYGEYTRISLERALVLKTDEKCANIIKNIPQMRNYILEELSDGIFIMDSLAEDEWREILKDASFEMMSETKGPEFNYSRYESESPFIELQTFKEINAERRIPYDEKIRRRLLSEIREKEPMLRKIREMLVLSGVIFDSTQLERPLHIETADAFNYMEKHRLIERAYKDKSLVLVVENHSGKIAAGNVEMVESFEEGDHMVLGHKMLSISRLYRVALLPSSLL